MARGLLVEIPVATGHHGGVIPSFRLRAGDVGPTQQSSITCGSACLTVARMLVDPVFASWVRTGSPSRPGAVEGDSPSARFAAYEQVVMRRTNALISHGGLHLPWPRFWGTPPWGARRELEFGAARDGTCYRVENARHLRATARRADYQRLVEVVADGEPGLLYVGSRLLPRHVVLVLPGDGDRTLDVFDPGSGRVSHLRLDDYVNHRLGLSTWNVPWFIVSPTGTLREREQSWLPARGLRVQSGTS